MRAILATALAALTLSAALAPTVEAATRRRPTMQTSQARRGAMAQRQMPRGGDAQNADVDRLNDQALARARGQ